MNKLLLSLCLLGAGFSVANILILPPKCVSGGTEVATVAKEAPAPKAETVNTAQVKPATPKVVGQKAKPQTSTSNAPIPQTKLAQAPTAPAEQLPAAVREVDVTNSVGRKPSGQATNRQALAPGSVDRSVAAKVEPTKADEPAEWAEVTLAARVHDAPSVSAPTVRFYPVGTRLRVIGRESGWIKVLDPTTSKKGWIYQEYLTPKQGPATQPARSQAAPSIPNDVGTLPQPEPYARPYRQRKHGWRWYRVRRPAFGVEFGMHPGW